MKIISNRINELTLAHTTPVLRRASVVEEIFVLAFELLAVVEELEPLLLLPPLPLPLPLLLLAPCKGRTQPPGQDTNDTLRRSLVTPKLASPPPMTALLSPPAPE